MSGRTIVVCGKGGVGKTTVSALMSRHLAAAAALRTLAVDADHAVGLALALGIEPDTTLGDVKDGVENLTHIRCSWTAATTRWRDKLFHNHPLLIAQITWITNVIAGMLSSGDISPGHVDLLRIFHNPNEPQTSDITQLVFGQALRF